MFTGYNIQSIPNPSRWKDQIICRIRFMHGDGDSYSEEIVRLDGADVVPLANFLELCDDQIPEAEGGKGYTKLEGYKKWEDYFPRDITCETTHASLDGYAFHYYDPNGQEHDINLETE